MAENLRVRNYSKQTCHYVFESEVFLTVLIYVCSLDIGTSWIQVNKQNRHGFFRKETSFDNAARDLERFKVYSEGRGSAAFAEVINVVNAF